MKYLPSIVLFVGAFLPEMPSILCGVAMGMGFLLALAALGKSDIPFVDIRNMRWPDVK